MHAREKITEQTSLRNVWNVRKRGFAALTGKFSGGAHMWNVYAKLQKDNVQHADLVQLQNSEI